MTFLKKLVLTGCVASASILGTHPALGQAADDSVSTPTGLLHFAFRDSVTGVMVKPEAILIDEKMDFKNIDDAGRVTINVAPGDHRVVVKARGYDDLDSRQTATADHAPMNVMMLDPIEQPEMIKPENLGKDMPADGTFIAGFVVDDVMAKPIAGADVELLKKDVKVTTDENGFFKLPVAMPDGKLMPENPRGVTFSQRDFKVSKPGYGFEERLNVLVESGSPKIYQVQLIRGGGGVSVDETEGRNNLQSSLFGLRNVEPEDPETTETEHNHDHDHDHDHDEHTSHTHVHQAN